MTDLLPGMDFYSYDELVDQLEHTSLDAAVAEFLDQQEVDPPTVTIYGYKRRTISSDEPALDPENICTDILERLDDEYGGDRDGSELPTAKMTAAAAALAVAIRSEYQPWECEQAGSVTVDVVAWRAEGPEL